MVVIVGVGALGSHVALTLRNLAQPIKLIDFDRVEQKNTLAQFHSQMGLRRNKASALAQSLQGLFGTKVEVVPHELTADNVEVLLAGAALVIDCTDNLKARQLIQGHCSVSELPCLHGALSADGSFARIAWDEEFAPDAEGAEGEATCEGGEHLPFFVAAAAYMAISAQSFLAAGKKMSFQLTPGGFIRLT